MSIEAKGRDLAAMLGISVEEVRKKSKQAGKEIGDLIALMDDTEERRELEAKMADMQAFWDRASEGFLFAWLAVAVMSEKRDGN